MYCEKKHVMNLYFGSSICWNRSKYTCRKKVNIRNGNFFTNTLLPFVTSVRFIYLWAKDLTSIKICNEELEINKNITVEWNNYMREICVQDLLKKPKQKIGGEELIVEIDDSVFTKRKYFLSSGLLEDYVVQLINVF